jgi:hypothetical protein
MNLFNDFFSSTSPKKIKAGKDIKSNGDDQFVTKNYFSPAQLSVPLPDIKPTVSFDALGEEENTSFQQQPDKDKEDFFAFSMF